MDAAYAQISEKSHTGFNANRRKEKEKEKKKLSVHQLLLIYKQPSKSG